MNMHIMISQSPTRRRTTWNQAPLHAIAIVTAVAFQTWCEAETPVFTRIDSGPIAEAVGNFRDAAWGDYDNDGDLDLLVCRRDGPNLLFENLGDGSFRRVIAEGEPGIDSGNSMSASWADYDNDGWLDLFICNHAQANDDRLYRNNGDGTFTRMTTGPLVTEPAGSVGSAWADYDNDGYLDLFVGHVYQAGNRLYRGEEYGSFVQVTDQSVGNDAAYSAACGWADYDNDGDLDLFVGNGILEQEQLDFLYRNDGGGTFTKILFGPVVENRAFTRGCDWGDYDNDGYPDLFVANYLGALNRLNFLYHNEGNGTFARVTEGDIATDELDSTGAVWGDYDNDGDLDLFLANNESDNVLYENQGDGTFQIVDIGDPISDGGFIGSVSWCDYDNDGDLDLLLPHGTSGTVNSGRLLLYRNEGTKNSWLRVRCIGTQSNRSAVGAKVRAKAVIRGAETWQMRQVTAGTAMRSVPPSETHFGLGDATTVDILRIEWPSGAVQELRDVPANRILTVTEPPRLIPQGAGAFQIQCWINQSFDVEASTDLTGWSNVATVTNLTGKLVFADAEAGQHDSRYYRVVVP